MIKRVSSIAIAALLTACGAMPSKVSLPKHLDESAVDTNGRPTTAGASKTQYDNMVGDMGIQPVAMSRKAVLYQINLLIGDWNSRASVLLGERDIADNATFWGTAVAAGLVMSNEMKAAKYLAGDLHLANKSTLAATAIDQMGQLYGIDREVKKLSPEDRLRERRTLAVPIAQALHDWLMTYRAKVPDGSARIPCYSP